MEKKESREVNYKLAVKLLDLMLKNGFLLPEEYEKIDALNRLTFQPELSKVYAKSLDILQKLWYCVVLTGEMIIRKVYLNSEKWRKGEEK